MSFVNDMSNKYNAINSITHNQLDDIVHNALKASALAIITGTVKCAIEKDIDNNNVFFDGNIHRVNGCCYCTLPDNIHLCIEPLILESTNSRKYLEEEWGAEYHKYDFEKCGRMYIPFFQCKRKVIGTGNGFFHVVGEKKYREKYRFIDLKTKNLFFSYLTDIAKSEYILISPDGYACLEKNDNTIKETPIPEITFWEGKPASIALVLSYSFEF